MQDHREAEACAEPLGIVAECHEGRRCSREKKVENDATVPPRDLAQLGGQGEDDVEVVCG
jgi:hypothetical protein